jgi:hypothetical protein
MPAGRALDRAKAGLAAPARVNASAPPQTNTTSFLVICRTRALVLTQPRPLPWSASDTSLKPARTGPGRRGGA